MYHVQCAEEHEPVDEGFEVLVCHLVVEGYPGGEALERLVVGEAMFWGFVALLVDGPLIHHIKWGPSCSSDFLCSVEGGR